MSLMGSKLLFGLALAFVLLASSVNAHGWMSSPTPRGQYLTPPKPEYMEYGPASRDPNDPMFACRGDPVAPKANWIPLTAGQSQAITLQFNAKHVGDCFVYLSYDGDKPVNQMKWFKIWEQHACKDSVNYNVPIPSYLPSGDHVVFRWEWYALHVYPIVEYYAQCVDATMTGVARGALPQPQVNIPGHLPVFAGEYSATNPTNNYWWPWDNQPMFFTGPPVATPNGQPLPVSTNRPTTPALPTTTPTTAPPAQATTKPATPAPLQSVKLNILPGSGQWWFAVTLAGHRSDEIVKVELKDGGHITAFSGMVKSWTDATLGAVWVFDAAARGPLTAPLTIKASLASGSSVTFTANGIASTVIDSGVVFP